VWSELNSCKEPANGCRDMDFEVEMGVSETTAGARWRLLSGKLRRNVETQISKRQRRLVGTIRNNE